jgi:hypothetical protein
MKHKRINLLFFTLVIGLFVAGMVLGTAGTASPVQAAEDEDFYGWRLDDRTPGYPVWPGAWVKGNLQKEWREGDWVSYVFILNGYGGAPLPAGFKIRYDTLQASSGAILVDLVRNFSYKIRDPYPSPGEPTDVTPANFTTWRDGTWVPSEINVPCDGAGNPITNSETSPGAFAYFTLDSGAFGTIPTGKSLVIYFELHLARTFVWSNGLEGGYNSAPYNAWGGTRYAGWTTDSWLGSGFVTGSSGHANEIGGGAKTVPIPIPPEPEGLIDGYKFEDLNNNGEPREEGEPGIGGWRIYVVGEDPDGLLLTGSALTDGTGFYSIPNLTAGIWYIAENISRESPFEDFWSQTYPNGGSALVPPVADPMATNLIPLAFPGSPALADWGYAVNLTETYIEQHNVDFGNVGTGCLRVCKILDTSEVVGPLSELPDGTFVINVTGPSYPTGTTLSFPVVDGAIVGEACKDVEDLTPGSYTVTETSIPSGWVLQGISGSPATVSAGGACGDVTVNVTNEPDLGCLEVCKILDTSEVVGPLTELPDGTFVINVTGPSYPTGTTLSFPVVDGAIVGEACKDVEDLTPGLYTVTETSIPSGWVLQGISGSPATVSAGGACGDVTVNVTNEPGLGCLEVTKVVDLDDYMFASSANATFNITLTGPSYPTGLNLTFEMVNGDVFYVDDLGGDTACLCSLIPGNYTVTEDLPVGWNLTGITPPQPVEVEPGTACNDTAVEVTVTNRLLIPHTTMSEMTYVYDSASGNVSINITDCNDGEVPLTDAVVYLRANNVTYPFSPMGYSSPYFAGGDTNLNPGDSAGVMDPDECWTWVVNVTINGTTFFEAWGDAIDPLNNHVGYDPDTGEGYESEYQSFEIVSCWGDETAWAYGEPYDNENWDYADGSNWGWTNGPLSEGSYVWDLYAGAGQNDISKGTLVGNVSVSYLGGCVNVTYMVDDGYYLGETHLWVGNNPLPQVTRGHRPPAYTDAPGQFPYGVDYGFNASDPGTWETEWSWSGCGFSSDIYVAAHGVVWMEVECEPVDSLVATVETDSSVTVDSSDSFWGRLLDWFSSRWYR